jgi:hypothetical protein
MTKESINKRFSSLAPLSVQDQENLALAAFSFFSPIKYEENCQIIKRTPTPGTCHPFDGGDFLKYLESAGILAQPRKYQARIAELIARLENARLLTPVGYGKDIFISKSYYFLKQLTTLEKKGLLWLSEALGPEFIRKQYSPFIVQITGVTDSGDEHAGTGLIIGERYILTCAHVLKDMKIHDQQTFQSQSFRVRDCLAHPSADVGLLKLEEPLRVLDSLSFRDPAICEALYTMGYPRVPLARSAPLVMQSGEVTSTDVTLLHGEEVFLYSAVARPGNSGGPIVSSTGHILGIVTQELSEESITFSTPFHAGVKTSTIRSLLKELDPSIILPIEDYE